MRGIAIGSNNLGESGRAMLPVANRTTPAATRRIPAASKLIGAASASVLPSLAGVPTEQRFSADEREVIALAETLVKSMDDHKRPKNVPQLVGWGTPVGWQAGLRPRCVGEQKGAERSATGNGQLKDMGSGVDGHVLHEIEKMEGIVGKRMYPGLLKSVARVWKPQDIQDNATGGKVLEHLQAAERGLVRARAARDKAGLTAFAAVLGSLRLSSLDQVDNLKTLHEIVTALETATKPESSIG